MKQEVHQSFSRDPKGERENFLDINGFRLHFIDEGAGDPVVMLHGNPTWSFYYRNLTARCAATIA